MAQIGILSGIYTDQAGEFRSAYPRNLQPVPKSQGISEGYLRPGDGLLVFGTGPGRDRGGIVWNGTHYRVMGTALVSVSAGGIIATIGDVGSGDFLTMDYSFDRLAITSGGRLYYWDGATLTQVSDPDLGTALCVIYLDGYFLTTDGESIVQTELNDPTIINPLKYGSAEADPDPLVRLLKPRAELSAVGRYTIEQFQNIGGEFFAFQRVEGAIITKGAVGTLACCEFQDSIALLGGGRNEPISVYLAYQGTANKIATREIETVLEGYSEAALSACRLESRQTRVSQLLYIHLPDQSLVYDAAASAALSAPVWYTLTSSVVGLGQYRAQGWVYAYGAWIFGDPQSSNLGIASDRVSSHYGAVIGWDYSTAALYSNGKGAIISEMELVALPGRVNMSANPVIWTSYSLDGVNFSTEMAISTGGIGNYDKRLVWRRQGFFKNWRIQRFRGTSDSHLSMARLEMTTESLYA